MLSRIAQFLITFYGAAISPMLGKNCRFSPTCSAYARESFECHGFLKGSYLTLKRVCKCHPVYRGSRFDPVPEKPQK